jgi:hypothetical protein
VASVADIKSAINAALAHVRDGQIAVRDAGGRLDDAQRALAAAVHGSGHDAVNAAHAALRHASVELDECLAATLRAVEQAESYASVL